MPHRTTHLRFSPDGKALAAGMVGGQVRFMTSDALQPMAQVREILSLVVCVRELWPALLCIDHVVVYLVRYGLWAAKLEACDLGRVT